MDKALIYFGKYPEPGKVKTRLAKTIGLEAAANAYRSLAGSIFHTLSNGEIKNKDFETIVFFDPPEKEPEIKAWLPNAATYWPQEGKDLEDRLIQSFRMAFESGARRVLALVSDTLGFKGELITKAFEALDHYDVVIGPAEDGGYYLIGLSEAYDCLFQEIPWSTSEVLKTTLGWIHEEGLSYYLLPQLDDLDEIPATKHVGSVTNCFMDGSAAQFGGKIQNERGDKHA